MDTIANCTTQTNGVGLMTYGKPPSSAPLKTAVLHILLALSSSKMHGLGIAEVIEKETDGEIRIGPGTLYRSLKEMTSARLVEHVRASESGSDPRRKYYHLTELGLEVLQAEAARLARIVDVAKRRRVLSSSA